MSRKEDLDKFYQLIWNLEQIIEGKKFLSHCNGFMAWPERGVYFFFEKSECRENGNERVVRVGTHGLKLGSSRTLWNRLRQHRGTLSGDFPGGGNHRGSIFRLHVGTAIISKNGFEVPSWAEGNTAKREVRKKEHFLERLVSTHIRSMRFLWVEVNDSPGPNSMRGYIERNAIALISNFGKSEVIDPSSANWLGSYAENEKIRTSGLWNVDKVEQRYDPAFLDILKKFVEEM